MKDDELLELMQKMSMRLFEQTERWNPYAHYRSCAVPYKAAHKSAFVQRCMKMLGIGLIAVPSSDFVTEFIPAQLNRKAMADQVRKALKPEHKTHAEAGNANGRRWSPFKSTCREIRTFVEHNSGCNLKTIIASIDHHYSSPSSAKQCISMWAQRGIIPGIRCEREGKQLRFYVNP